MRTISYKSVTGYYAATRAEIKRKGMQPIRALNDRSGNCIFCGECGRCPGYHALEDIHVAMRNMTVRDTWRSE
jgi:heterodisulfide reductase subunit C